MDLADLERLRQLYDGGIDHCLDLDEDGVRAGCVAQPDCDDSRPESYPGAEELCDTRDNDCDGEVDEGTQAGQACNVNTPGCSLPGTWQCFGQSEPVCEPEAPPAEFCDGLDQDCDGLIDEGNPGGGAACNTGLPGVCGQGFFLCASGGLGCIAEIVQGQNPEVCNAQDDDCDGHVDEKHATGGAQRLRDDCYFGPPDTEGLGECKAGEWECANGRWGPCLGEVRPVTEICDLKDNDCNGMQDDGQMDCACGEGQTQPGCYGGPPGTADVGECESGYRTCAGGVWGACLGQVVPVAEVCNGEDDDCDGTVDDGFDIGQACTSGVGACEVAGVFACDPDPAVGASCTAVADMPAAETCNGEDDDCDGRTDEVPGVGANCSAGLGACTRPGVMVCDAMQGALACNAVAGQPAPEACNMVDDDCDGTVDEGFAVGDDCSVGVGACVRSGNTVCAPDGTARCSVQPGGPGAELCDTLDNDCDGQTDEGFGIGNVCAGVGSCGDGVWECAPNGAARCSTADGGSQDQTGPESCDSADNDCDGNTDENYFGLGEACTYYCPNGQQRPGELECIASGAYTQCSAAPEGSDYIPEACGNAVDDDCDNNVDEGCP